MPGIDRTAADIGDESHSKRASVHTLPPSRRFAGTATELSSITAMR